ncbi:MAG: 4Fe-4S dicluster domain-containing protein [Candidatus Eisenbacteria bacterium]
MKLRGGYSIPIAGRPSSRVGPLPVPGRLLIPKASRRFDFSDVLVTDGQRVSAGDVLATDPSNHSVPLLAPCGGTVRLEELAGHLVLDGLEDTAGVFAQAASGAGDAGGASTGGSPSERGAGASADEMAAALVRAGAWQLIADAHTGRVPPPDARPSAVIVSTMHLEPFVARGHVHLHGRLAGFLRGLERIQGFLEYERIYLVVPDLNTPFARAVRNSVRGGAWVQLVPVPLRYPFDNLGVLARHLRFRRDPDHPVWGLGTAGVFAVDGALTHGRPVLGRIVAVGGPAVDEPVHVRAVTGYPLEELLAGRTCGSDLRVLQGGALTGEAVGTGPTGLDCEATGVTVLAEESRRTLLAFARPGWSRHSYGKTFLTSICPGPPERLKTGLRGELRPCIACGQCVDVCPAGILPNVIHKYLYADDIDEAQRTRVDLCVECGLCSYVCPSKIDLREQFVEAKRAIREEQEREEADRAEAAEAESRELEREESDSVEAEA